MKVPFIIIPLILIFTIGRAQYKKGDLDVVLGGGVGLYGVTTNDDADSSSNLGATSGLLQLTINYAFFDRLSLGIDLERGIFNPPDSGYSELYAHSNNIRLNILFRMVNIEMLSFSVRGITGFSMFTIGNRYNKVELKASGFTYELGVHYHQFLGRRWGLYMNTAYAYYRYAKFKDRKEKVITTVDGSKDFVLNLSGVNIRLGVILKM